MAFHTVGANHIKALSPSSEDDKIIGETHPEDEVVICPYISPLTKKKQYSLVLKKDPLNGYNEVLSKTKEASYKGLNYSGKNCSIPALKKPIPSKDYFNDSLPEEIRDEMYNRYLKWERQPFRTARDSFLECVYLILRKRYHYFLYKNPSIRNGIMTTARIGPFNEFMNSNLVHYNSNDRHLYPKKYQNSNEDDMVLYLYKDHFCSISKKNKAAGIKEIEENYNKHVVFTRCNDKNVKELGLYHINTSLTENKVYISDLETYPDLKKNRFSQE
jgi:hypothetical protein